MHKGAPIILSALAGKLRLELAYRDPSVPERTDETEVLEAEVEEQRMEIAAGIAQEMLRRQWTTLISVIGVPSLP